MIRRINRSDNMRPILEYNTNNNFQVGMHVYFQAYIDKENKDNYFLCQGYITREPTHTSKVYKVIVIAINTYGLFSNTLDYKKAKLLLNKKIACDSKSLFQTPTNWMKKIYANDNWLRINNTELQKILCKFKRIDNAKIRHR
jgi:hypothetical protein